VKWQCFHTLDKVDSSKGIPFTDGAKKIYTLSHSMGCISWTSCDFTARCFSTISACSRQAGRQKASCRITQCWWAV